MWRPIHLRQQRCPQTSRSCQLWLIRWMRSWFARLILPRLLLCWLDLVRYWFGHLNLPDFFCFSSSISINPIIWCFLLKSFVSLLYSIKYNRMETYSILFSSSIYFYFLNFTGLKSSLVFSLRNIRNIGFSLWKWTVLSRAKVDNIVFNSRTILSNIVENIGNICPMVKLETIVHKIWTKKS